MIRPCPVFFGLLPLLAACGGGGSSAPVPPVVPPISPLSVTEVNADPMWASATVSMDLLYLGNIGNNSISVYKHDAKGNTKPLRVIIGSNTGIDMPGQLSGDAQGHLYVANGSFGATGQSSHPAVLVFAAGANGNVAPIRNLAGARTGIHHIDGMTVDKSTGEIFVVDSVPDPTGPAYLTSLLRFAANATGNVAPLARSAAALPPAIQLASDSTGRNLLEAHTRTCEFCTGDDGVTTLAKAFGNNSAPSVPFETGWFSTHGVADDPTTKTYLSTGTSDYGTGIYRFAEDTVGSGNTESTNVFKPAVVSIITSDTCGAQLALPPGPTPNTYVVHSTPRCPTDAVYVYTLSASGNAAPLRVLSGPATNLNQPFGIYEGK